jgi:hypothetical protein
MATVNDIHNQILQEKTNQDQLAGLDTTSKSGIFYLSSYAVAIVVFLQYKFFDTYKIELDIKIREQKKYSQLWFRERALAYRHGEGLLPESDEYAGEPVDDTNFPVKRAAVIELELNNRKQLFIKVASENSSELVAVSDSVKAGLTQYFAIIKPAGTKIVVFTGPADDLKLDIRFYYDPLIFDQNGARIDGSANTIVQDTIREYLKDLKFNGEFTLAALEDLLQNIEGCADREAYIDNAEANYLTPPNYQSITSNYVANSGYMQIIDENLNIDFIPKTVQL